MTDWPERFKSFRSLYVVKDGEEEGEWIRVEQARVQRAKVILKFEEIESRDEAETLRDCELWISKEELPSLPEDFYYISDLIGCSVKEETGEQVGILKDVVQNSTQDIYVVDAEGQEILIPAVKAFIKNINIKERIIIISPIEGLLNLDEN